MAEIVMIPLSGVLSRAFSMRWLFTVSAAGFTLASIGCGFATNIETMIVMRAIQGFVGGAMIPTVFATGFALFPGPKQALIAAILGMSGSLAPTIGPTLGGWITETYSWHWLFFINVIPGVIIASAIPVLGRVDDPSPSLLRNFDILGLGLLAIALGSLEYVLEEGYRWGWMDDPDILRLTWISAVAGALFIWRSLRHPSPVVDFRALKKPHLCDRHPLHLRYWVRAFRRRLCAAALSRKNRRIQCLANRRGRFQCRSRHGPVGAVDRQAFTKTRSAPAHCRRTLPLRPFAVADDPDHFRMDRTGVFLAAIPARLFDSFVHCSGNQYGIGLRSARATEKWPAPSSTRYAISAAPSASPPSIRG
jgi:Major Facilitator Superfamily